MVGRLRDLGALCSRISETLRGGGGRMSIKATMRLAILSFVESPCWLPII